MAGPTRLELATSCVTGRRSNQLNYDPAEGYCSKCRAMRPRTAILAKQKMADFDRQPANKYQRKDALSTGF